MRTTSNRARAAIAVLLALFLSLGVAACGSDDDDDDAAGEGGGAIVSNPDNGKVRTSPNRSCSARSTRRHWKPPGTK